MTISRLCTLTAERQTVVDLLSYVTTAIDTSSTKKKTGDYSYRTQTTDGAFGRAIGGRSTVRVGYWINHVGLNAAGKVQLVLFSTGTDPDESPTLRLEWDAVTGNLLLLRATASGTYETLDSVLAPAALIATDTWIHIGVVYKSDGSTGYFALYINGTVTMITTGDTRLSYWNGVGGGGSAQLYSTTFDRFYVAGRHSASFNGWNGDTYVDDLYVDSYDGESVTTIPHYRFDERIFNGAGSDAEWTPATSTNVSQIDDGAPNGGANDGVSTYVHTEAVDLRDSFTFADITVPVGHTLTAVIPFAHARKLDGAIDTQLALHLYDGVDYQEGSDQVLPLDYAIELFTRFPTQFDASDWDQTAVNALEGGYISRGDFA
jgi:hypothetical protein